MTRTATVIHRFKPKSTLAACALLALCLLAVPQLALAVTAANSNVTNTVTVHWEDAASNTFSDTTSVTVVVTTKPSNPTLTYVSTAPGTTVPESTQVTLNYTLTSNANGPDTFDLASSQANVSNVSDAANLDVFASGAANTTIDLGGTIITSGAGIGSSTIRVAYDNDYDTDNTITNGITAGDTIVIGVNEYTVAAGGISEVPASNWTDITLTSTLTAAVSIGDVVGEKKSFNVVFDAGAFGTPPTGWHQMDTSATSQADNTKLASDTNRQIDVERPGLTITKYVRNESDAAANTGTADINYLSTNYFSTAGDVTGKPGNTLRYLIEITNNSSLAVNNVYIDDSLSTYSTLTANSVQVDHDGIAGIDHTMGGGDSEAGGDAAGIVVTDTDDAANATAIKVFVGTGSPVEGANYGAAGTGGSIAASGGKAYIIYDVTIK